MPIDGGLRDKLEPGTVLTGKYKGAEHRAEVVIDEVGSRRYRLVDGREFKSPSAAASAVMGGQAANGWRFWSLASETAPEQPKVTRAGRSKAQPTAPVEETQPDSAPEAAS